MEAADRTLPNGLFIVFEGIDGTGKSTQINLLADELKESGYPVVTTYEPTNGPYGQKIRELFVNRSTVSHEEELELFMADRRQHVKNVIAPALAKGQVVLSDRYYLSTAAYQGANGLDPDDILARNKTFAPIPDLALILEIEPALGIHRIQEHRQESPNTFEEESNLHRVAAIFKSLQEEYIRRIDASKTVEAVHQQVMQEVKKVLSQKKQAA
ncbi:MAG: dTMP kinase [Proteobacteria bacterium]|nr:dTMP kinase [Pseudomonadota bacterium]